MERRRVGAYVVVVVLAMLTVASPMWASFFSVPFLSLAPSMFLISLLMIKNIAGTALDANYFKKEYVGDNFSPIFRGFEQIHDELLQSLVNEAKLPDFFWLMSIFVMTSALGMSLYYIPAVLSVSAFSGLIHLEGILSVFPWVLAAIQMTLLLMSLMGMRLLNKHSLIFQKNISTRVEQMNSQVSYNDMNSQYTQERNKNNGLSERNRVLMVEKEALDVKIKCEIAEKEVLKSQKEVLESQVEKMQSEIRSMSLLVDVFHKTPAQMEDDGYDQPLRQLRSETLLHLDEPFKAIASLLKKVVDDRPKLTMAEKVSGGASSKPGSKLYAEVNAALNIFVERFMQRQNGELTSSPPVTSAVMNVFSSMLPQLLIACSTSAVSGIDAESKIRLQRAVNHLNSELSSNPSQMDYKLGDSVLTLVREVQRSGMLDSVNAQRVRTLWMEKGYIGGRKRSEDTSGLGAGLS